MNNLYGKVALVTGAASGLGRAFAQALANEGAKLSVCDVRDDIHDVAPSLGSGTMAFRADVSRPEDVLRVVETTHAVFGRIDVLVNNAGVWAESQPTDDLDKSEHDYDWLIDTNLKGVFMFGRAVIPHMIAQRGGDIVNICTDHVQTCGTPWPLDHDDAPSCPWAGRAPRPTGGGPSMDLYDAGKWGHLGLTFAWSQALRSHDIRVNALCMGATDTEMLRSFHRFEPPAEEVARWMRPQDVARILVELIHDGRTGDYVGVAMGHPIALPARRANPYFLAARAGG